VLAPLLSLFAISSRALRLPFGSRRSRSLTLSSSTSRLDLGGDFAKDLFEYGIDIAIAEESIRLGNFEEAEKLANAAAMIAEKTGKPSLIFKAYAEGIVGDALYQEANFQAAANAYKAALVKYEQVYKEQQGPEAAELVASTALIASVLVGEKNKDTITSASEAVSYKSMMDSCELFLGLQHHIAQPTNDVLGLALLHLGVAHAKLAATNEQSFGTAESLLRRAINVLSESSKRDFGPFDTPTTVPLEGFASEERRKRFLLSAYLKLAGLYSDTGDTQRAEAPLVSAYAMHLDSLPGSPVYTSKAALECIKKLGLIYLSSGRLAAAEACFSRALEVLKESNGVKEPHVDDVDVVDEREAQSNLSNLEQVEGLLASTREAEAFRYLGLE